MLWKTVKVFLRKLGQKEVQKSAIVSERWSREKGKQTTMNVICVKVL